MQPLKHMVLLPLLVPLFLCASCDTRTRQPVTRPSAVDNDPFVKLAPTPTEEPVEPDWKARYQSLKENLIQSFGAPRVGKTMIVKLKSGTERKGILTDLSDNEVTLAFVAGEVSYPRTALSAQTRTELFAEDYAQARAIKLVERDRENFRRKQAAEASAGGANDSSAPFNDPKDQSVWQVKDYLKETLKDPNTIRYQEWSPVMKTGRGYQVVCTYQAKAGSFGLVTEKKVFHMTESGRVTTASAVRMILKK